MGLGRGTSYPLHGIEPRYMDQRNRRLRSLPADFDVCSSPSNVFLLVQTKTRSASRAIHTGSECGDPSDTSVARCAKLARSSSCLKQFSRKYRASTDLHCQFLRCGVAILQTLQPAKRRVFNFANFAKIANPRV